MEDILQDETFKVITRDPTGKIERVLVKLLKETTWAEVQNALKSVASCPPRLYWAPIIHKQGYPF